MVGTPNLANRRFAAKSETMSAAPLITALKRPMNVARESVRENLAATASANAKLKEL